VVGDSIDRLIGEVNEPCVTERLVRIKDQIGQAQYLASELLSLGSDYQLSFDKVEVRAFLAMVIVALRERFDPKYRIEYTGGDTPLPIRADTRHLRRVFENLVGNACDAMPEGGVVTLWAGRLKRPGGVDSVAVHVADTGTGIAEGILDKVFDPFVTTKGPGKGTGLGLALVQHLVNLHKGTISVERSGPAGTTFCLEFPAADTLEINRDTHWMLSPRQRTRVLVLDDDPRIREVLRAFLVGLKYDTCEAGSLAEARRELTHWRTECRVLVMDWHIEGEEPSRILRELRAIVPSLLVIVVSGYLPDRAAIRDLGICRWFTKPYDRNLLDVEIQRTLFMANGREEEHTSST